MAERIIYGFKRLFEVRLLHHYWLDDGSAIFDTLSESIKTKLLLAYDARTFLEILPTPTTANRIKALRGIYKNTATGFVVAVPKSTIIPDDEVFSFVITVTSSDFFNYTALTFIDHKIHELYFAKEDKIYRYKENVPVFSNLTGTSRGVNPEKSLFLSKEIPASALTDKAEFLNLKAEALIQLINSQPGAATQTINEVAANMPVFFHQSDTPAIVPPSGLTGNPENGILLSYEISDNIFGLIHIAATNPIDADLSCITAGSPKERCPVFQIRFKNRSAYRKHIDKNTSLPVSESITPLPLTYNGNAGVKKKPGESIIKVQFQDKDPAKRIEKIYTEIFE